MPDRKPRASPADISAAAPRIKELYESGMTTGAIAKEVGISKESVRRSLITSGVEVVNRGNGRPRKNPLRTPLSEEEVEKLRRIVGFDPNTDLRGIGMRRKDR